MKKHALDLVVGHFVKVTDQNSKLTKMLLSVCPICILDIYIR